MPYDGSHAETGLVDNTFMVTVDVMNRNDNAFV